MSVGRQWQLVCQLFSLSPVREPTESARPWGHLSPARSLGWQVSPVSGFDRPRVVWHRLRRPRAGRPRRRLAQSGAAALGLPGYTHGRAGQTARRSGFRAVELPLYVAVFREAVGAEHTSENTTPGTHMTFRWGIEASAARGRLSSRLSCKSLKQMKKPVHGVFYHLRVHGATDYT